MKLSNKQKRIIDLCKTNSLRPHPKGGFFYFVSTTERRSGQMRVSVKEINTLTSKGLI